VDKLLKRFVMAVLLASIVISLVGCVELKENKQQLQPVEQQQQLQDDEDCCG